MKPEPGIFADEDHKMLEDFHAAKLNLLFFTLERKTLIPATTSST